MTITNAEPTLSPSLFHRHLMDYGVAFDVLRRWGCRGVAGATAP